MRCGRQAADAGALRGIVWIEAELQLPVRPPHLLIVPIVIAVVELREIGVAFDEARFVFRDHAIRLRRCNLPQCTGWIAKPCRVFEAQARARNPEAVVRSLVDRIEPPIQRRCPVEIYTAVWFYRCLTA